MIYLFALLYSATAAEIAAVTAFSETTEDAGTAARAWGINSLFSFRALMIFPTPVMAKIISALKLKKS